MSTDEQAGTVYGLDNVPLDLPLAGVGSRVLAGFIDYMVVALLGVLWLVGAVIGGAALARGATGMTAPLVVVAVAVVGLFLVEYGYFAGFEIGTGGRTPGKIALGLHVVTRQGAQPTWAALLGRNLVRTIDLAIGVPLMIIDPAARRLGDRLAGTLVVYQDPLALGSETPIARLPSAWGAAEVALVESFLTRERELDRDRALRIASLLLEAIQRDEPQLLDGLAAVLDPVLRLRRALTAKAA
jgi:uncharacterized RDD family membrane protein YckC